jgi:hypothetical protein
MPFHVSRQLPKPVWVVVCLSEGPVALLPKDSSECIVYMVMVETPSIAAPRSPASFAASVENPQGFYRPHQFRFRQARLSQIL